MAAQGPSRRRVSTQPSIRPTGELRQVANRAAGGTASDATGLSFCSIFQRKKSTRKERAEERGRRRTCRRAHAPTGRTRGKNGTHPKIGSHPWGRGRGAPPRRRAPEEDEEEESEGRCRWTRRRIGQTKSDARCNSEKAHEEEEEGDLREREAKKKVGLKEATKQKRVAPCYQV